VERREASGPLGGRAASQDAAVVEQRLSAFRFPFFLLRPFSSSLPGLTRQSMGPGRASVCFDIDRGASAWTTGSGPVVTR